MNRWFRARWFSLLGRQRLRFHQVESALQNFRKSAEQEPHNLRTASEIAWCLYKLKDYQSAIDAYQSVIRQSPNYASAHACLGLALAAAQRHQEAIDELRRAIRMNPKIKDRGFWDHNLGTWLVYLDRWVSWQMSHVCVSRSTGGNRAMSADHQQRIEGHLRTL